MNELKNILVVLAAYVLQFAFLQDLPLTPYGNPYIYMWGILVLPFNTSKAKYILYAFVLGSIMDSLESSGGAHTIAMLIMVWFKPSIENVLYGFKDGKSDEGLIHLPLTNFLTQSIILVLLHHAVLFTLENYGFDHLTSLLLRISISTVLTTLLLVIGHLLFSKRYAA